ncbi:MAG: DNA-3-methyladenine glycosylase 2 [bacterium]|nr:DNA-3-methyladenine glycosylase 2 [bacterium]
MLPDHSACYDALLAHDPRFDGRFYVGVTSTRIYCRPVCRARTPKRKNCRFFSNAAAAEAAGFRPCMRCRPELAPGWGPVDAGIRIAAAAALLIEAGEVESGGMTELAVRLGVTDRHLRRVFRAEFGVSPVEYAQTQRLLMAKRLLADTTLPVTQVALAAGFSSLRRFNAAMRTHYGLSPNELRRTAASRTKRDEELRFELGYRPPFDWERLLAFLDKRSIAGVECVTDGSWARTLRLEHRGKVLTGWVRVSHIPDRCSLSVEVATQLLPALPAVLGGVRQVFDLGCDPHAVTDALGELAVGAPGLRVPGAIDGFEMAVRAILGQQITVKAAHTIAGRFAKAMGESVAAPWDELHLVFPTPNTVAAATPESIASLGIVRQRANALLALAREMNAGRLDLSPAADVEETQRRLCDLPGIGPWTAQYIALRALSWPDAWPSGDIALMKALGTSKPREADVAAEQWRPWRSYATLHLWRRLSEDES